MLKPVSAELEWVEGPVSYDVAIQVVEDAGIVGGERHGHRRAGWVRGACPAGVCAIPRLAQARPAREHTWRPTRLAISRPTTRGSTGENLEGARLLLLPPVYNRPQGDGLTCPPPHKPHSLTSPPLALLHAECEWIDGQTLPLCDERLCKITNNPTLTLLWGDNINQTLTEREKEYGN